MEVGSLFGGGDDAGADYEVAEVLAFIAFFGVAVDDGVEKVFDLVAGYVGFEEFAESLTRVAAAEIDVVNGVGEWGRSLNFVR